MILKGRLISGGLFNYILWRVHLAITNALKIVFKFGASFL